ncbi:hypothetical protein [Solemya velum gill symbiont]|uniref:hypothetical protein n=1 Tax=Solemya velum gill symbiont TaxID=2340 RepID=UPI000997FB5B|nr:hypothetical protein [Solemya velum gill symbiont]OOZ45402.1 hypothetical protein BOW37_03780 [Solemya velum gill symbiont]OOZ47048.1 hypothetical protein BOW38_04295 [Solemya velum gill symbiont]OOZ52148.1 hypothetical protein BOW40_03620 [Solemya velum gill symbiont]OOZ54987.1 hypothetical protein BOW41_04765 [Solemya velum gill symbiont]OOZ56664.1 hypothetical protein BOW42_06080 [Solemya velum gill symbiont]
MKRILYMTVVLFLLFLSSTTYADNYSNVEVIEFNTGEDLRDEHTIASPSDKFSPETEVIYAGFETRGSLKGIPLVVRFIFTPIDYTVFTNELLPDDWNMSSVTEGHMEYTKPDNGWPTGDYRIEISHNEELIGTTEFEVK